MRIVILSPGESTFVVSEGRAYASNGAIVQLVVPAICGRSDREKVCEDFEIVRIPYFFRGWQHLFHPIDNVYDGLSLTKLLNIPLFALTFLWAAMQHGRNADIIHCQWTPTVLFALPARWFFGCKIVVTARGSDLRLLPKWLNRYIMRTVDASIDCYGPQEWNIRSKSDFPSNYETLPLVTEIPAAGSVEMPDDLKRIYGEGIETFRILYLGRLDPLKETLGAMPIRILPQVIHRLRSKGMDVQLVYLGDGPLLTETKQSVTELGLEGHVKFLGYQSNPQLYIPFFNLGIGGIYFNAVSQEFSVQGVAQLQPAFIDDNPSGQVWADGENALIFQPGSVDSLEQVIADAYRNRLETKRIGEAGCDYISRYVQPIEEGGREYLEAFRTLMAH